MTPILMLIGALMMGPGAGFDAVLQQMQTGRDDVEAMIQSSFGYGYFGYPYRCAQIPMAKRPAVVTAVGTFAKTYTESPAFLEWYEEYRTGSKPQAPEEPVTMAAARRQQLAEANKGLAELEREMNNATGDTKEALRQALEMGRQMVAAMQASDPAQDAMADEAARQQYEASRREYEMKLAEWEKEFPSQNPRLMIAKRLKEFLEVTKSVDFDAETVGEEWKTFKKPEYEAKDRGWKLAFRAGKATTETARAFAQKWLDELE